MIDDLISADIQRILDHVDCEFFSGKKILVTGGAGFLGSFLCDTFIQANADVDCLDNFSTGLKENIDHLLDMSKFRLIEEDVYNFNSNSSDVYDVILHLASRASPEEYPLHPIDTLLANSLGTHKMLKLAQKCNSVFLYASSSEVYGDAEVVPTPESYWGNVNPIGPRSCYDEAKRVGEAFCMAFKRQYGIDVRIVRIHNTYGPRLRADGIYARALSRFITQALYDGDFTIYGDGSQTRSFCYVTDTILGILAVLKNENSEGQVFNIGNAHEISIIELVREIKNLVDCKSDMVFSQLPEDDPRRRCPEISKARNLLGWMPSIELSEGLQKTIEWIKLKNLKKN